MILYRLVRIGTCDKRKFRKHKVFLLFYVTVLSPPLLKNFNRTIFSVYEFFYVETASCHLPNATHYFILFFFFSQTFTFSYSHQLLLWKLFSFLIAILTSTIFVNMVYAYKGKRFMTYFFFFSLS